MDKETVEAEVVRLRWQIEMLSRSGKLSGESHRNRAFLFSEFVSRECECGPGREVGSENFYQAWSEWQRDQLGDGCGEDSPSVIGKIMRVLLPGVYRQTTSKNGLVSSAYRGITLKRGRQSAAVPNRPALEPVASASPVRGHVDPIPEPQAEAAPLRSADEDYVLELFPRAQLFEEREGLAGKVVYSVAFGDYNKEGEQAIVGPAPTKDAAWELAAVEAAKRDTHK